MAVLASALFPGRHGLSYVCVSTMYCVPTNALIKIISSHPFWHQGPVSWTTIFPRTRGAGGMVSG